MADLSERDRDLVFLDTTVLIGGLVDLGISSQHSLLIFDAVASGGLHRPFTAWHCCLEFFSVVTRLPEPFRLESSDASRLLEEEVFPRFEIVELPVSKRMPLFSEAVEEGYNGGRIYDLHIGEVARHSGAKTLVTDNRRHFLALLRHGMRVSSPGNFVAERRLV